MTDKWVRDTGLVFALLFLLLGYRFSQWFLAASALLLLALIFAPSALKPLAWTWQRVAEALAYVMNRVFFGLVFFAVIVPVGYVRRLLSSDMRDLELDTARTSLFVDGAGLISTKNISKPF